MRIDKVSILIRGILLALLIFAVNGHTATLPMAIHNAVKEDLKIELQQRGFTNSSNSRISYDISPVDPRLQLSRCTDALKVAWTTNSFAGRITAKVSCSSPLPWSIYVPVTVKNYRNVLAARSPLTRGHILRGEDLTFVEKDISRLTGGYFIKGAEIVGKEVSRTVPANGIITTRMVAEPKVISRGDEVVILADSGTLTIRSLGIAVSAGRVGQQIKVKNKSSNRLIKATVIKRGVVKVTI